MTFEEAMTAWVRKTTGKPEAEFIEVSGSSGGCDTCDYGRDLVEVSYSLPPDRSWLTRQSVLMDTEDLLREVLQISQEV